MKFSWRDETFPSVACSGVSLAKSHAIRLAFSNCSEFCKGTCAGPVLWKNLFFFSTFDQQLNDNSEALVHQRLATKMLAAKMREMEKDHSEQSPRKK